MLNIYGKYAPTLDKLLGQMMAQFEQLNKNYEKEHGERLYEHLRGRVKSEASMEGMECIYPKAPLKSIRFTIPTSKAPRLSTTFSQIFIFLRGMRNW